jgi:hypothetical protein
MTAAIPTTSTAAAAAMVAKAAAECAITCGVKIYRFRSTDSAAPIFEIPTYLPATAKCSAFAHA